MAPLTHGAARRPAGGGALPPPAALRRPGCGRLRAAAAAAPRRRRAAGGLTIEARRTRRVQDPIIPPAVPLGPHGEDSTDLMGYLLRNRIVFVGARISDEVATRTVAALLALTALDDAADIRLYINCAGGSPYAVVSILDTIRAVAAPVSTLGLGLVGGVAVHLLAAGAKGKRLAMPSTRILLQQPAGGAAGSADEVNITATELNRTMRVMNRFMAEFTGLDEGRVEEECDRDNFLSPDQAVALGLIDAVVPHRPRA